MPRKSTTNKTEPSSTITFHLPLASKTLMEQAAKASGFDSLSGFVRKTMVDQARAVLDRNAVNPAPSQDNDAAKADSVLYAYIGAAPPENCLQPAIAFPSLRSFAAHFSDRNRAVLRHLAGNTPRSIHDLAISLNYPYDSLIYNLSRLLGFGVIAYRGGAGSHLIPYLLRSRVTLIVPLSGADHKNPVEISCAIRSHETEALPAGKVIVFGSIDEFAAALPDRNHRLLLAIAEHRPDSIASLARLVGQEPKNLYRPVQALKRLGLVTTIGLHPKRPVPACDGLSLELVFSEMKSRITV